MRREMEREKERRRGKEREGERKRRTRVGLVGGVPVNLRLHLMDRILRHHRLQAPRHHEVGLSVRARLEVALRVLPGTDLERRALPRRRRPRRRSAPRAARTSRRPRSAEASLARGRARTPRLRRPTPSSARPRRRRAAPRSRPRRTTSPRRQACAYTRPSCTPGRKRPPMSSWLSSWPWPSKFSSIVGAEKSVRRRVSGWRLAGGPWYTSHRRAFGVSARVASSSGVSRSGAMSAVRRTPSSATRYPWRHISAMDASMVCLGP